MSPSKCRVFRVPLRIARAVLEVGLDVGERTLLLRNEAVERVRVDHFQFANLNNSGVVIRWRRDQVLRVAIAANKATKNYDTDESNHGSVLKLEREINHEVFIGTVNHIGFSNPIAFVDVQTGEVQQVGEA